MIYEAFLERAINDGIAEVKVVESYSDEQKRGAIDGFHACRHKLPMELMSLLTSARELTSAALLDDPDYWYYRMYDSQVEWVCNVVSAMLRNEGKPEIMTPTARGTIKAAEILKRGP